MTTELQIHSISMEAPALGKGAQTSGRRIPVQYIYLDEDSASWAMRSYYGRTLWHPGNDFVIPPEDTAPNTSYRAAAIVFSKNGSTIKVPMKFKGSFDFAAAGLTTDKGAFMITARNQNGVILSSAPVIPYPVDGKTIEVDGFTFGLPLVNFTSQGPFKCAGDWTWSLIWTNINPPGTKEFKAVKTTRLELFFVLGHLRRPFIADLLRMALIPVERLLGLSGETLVSDPRTCAKNIVQSLWDLGNPDRHYDTTTGKGNCCTCPIAEDFRPTLIDLTVFQWPMKPLTVNCHDLAGYTMLMCAELGVVPVDGVDQKEYPQFLDATFIYQSRFGYIRSGPLFGLTGSQDELRCNSPVWKHPKTGAALNKYFPPTDILNKKRAWFKNHAFAEYKDSDGTLKVLDACHGIYEEGGPYKLVDGSQTEAEYHQSQIDKGAAFPEGWGSYPTSDTPVYFRHGLKGNFGANTKITPLV